MQFILFLHKRHREALSPEFLQAADAFDESGLHAFIKKIVEERKSPSPILFASLQARHVSRFVVSLKRSDSSRATPAVHSAARSAVSDYFRLRAAEKDGPKSSHVVSRPSPQNCNRNVKGQRKSIHWEKTPGVLFVCFSVQRIAQSRLN